VNDWICPDPKAHASRANVAVALFFWTETPFVRVW
jgi:hypothetical protein